MVAGQLIACVPYLFVRIDEAACVFPERAVRVGVFHPCFVGVRDAPTSTRNSLKRTAKTSVGPLLSFAARRFPPEGDQVCRGAPGPAPPGTDGHV